MRGRVPAADHRGMETLPNPTRIAHPSPVTCLLAADLRSSSAHAADEAIDLAARQGAVLLVLSVVPPDGLPRWCASTRSRAPSGERRDRAAREVVARASARGRDRRHRSCGTASLPRRSSRLPGRSGPTSSCSGHASERTLGGCSGACPLTSPVRRRVPWWSYRPEVVPTLPRSGAMAPRLGPIGRRLARSIARRCGQREWTDRSARMVRTPPSVGGRHAIEDRD